MRESERKSEGWATRRKEQAGPQAMAGPGGGGGDLLLAVGAEVPLHEPAAPRAPGGKGVGGWWWGGGRGGNRRGALKSWPSGAGRAVSVLKPARTSPSRPAPECPVIHTNCKDFYSFLGPYINSCGPALRLHA